MSYYYPQACIKLRVLPEDFQLVSDASLQTPYELDVIAKDIVVNVNDHKTSDSFTAEIDYRSFPFDPRTVRYCGVVIYLMDVGPQRRATDLGTQGGDVQVIIPTDSHAVFAGFVDEATVTFDDTRRLVKFEGRDFTSLLIDQKYAENVPINTHVPLDQAIQQFLDKFKATKELKIVNRTGNTVLPTLAQFDPDFGSLLAGQKNAGPKESYWEIIQDMCAKCALIVYMDLDQLIITTPRNLYNPNADAQFLYGVNVKNLTFKRKLGRLKNFNIRVRSRVGKTVVTANIPEEAEPTWCKSFGIPRAAALVPVLKPDGSLDKDQQHKAPYFSFPVNNIGNKEQLIKIGQSVYEDYSRQQLEGSFDTYEMLSHSVDNPSIDLTQLEIGQPLSIEIATDDLNSISRLTDEQTRTDYLVKRNYDRSTAAAFAKSMGKFSPRFYTKSYTLSLNDDSGFKLHVDFINIIELSNRGLGSPSAGVSSGFGGTVA